MLRKIKSFIFILNSVGQADGILIPKLRKRLTLHAILMTLTTDIKQIFFETLHGDIPVLEFEQWLYTDKTLETVLPEDDYLDFISLSYKSSGARYSLYKLIEKQISLAEYEKWRLLKLLTQALNRDADLPNILMTFYDLYCKGYSFFDNLGLGYGLSVEVPYSYGKDSWDELAVDKKKELLDSFYPQIETEIKKVISWIENATIIPTGIRDNYDNFQFIDNRSQDEKTPTAYEVEYLYEKPPKKWWKFWSL